VIKTLLSNTLVLIFFSLGSFGLFSFLGGPFSHFSLYKSEFFYSE